MCPTLQIHITDPLGCITHLPFTLHGHTISWHFKPANPNGQEQLNDEALTLVHVPLLEHGEDEHGPAGIDDTYTDGDEATDVTVVT